jgi:hypothetical protein
MQIGRERDIYYLFFIFLTSIYGHVELWNFGYLCLVIDFGRQALDYFILGSVLV